MALAGEQHLQRLKHFVHDHDAQLRAIEHALTDALATPGDAALDPIALDATPYEQTNLLELVRTDNRLFNKVLKVFAWLMDEATLLERIVSASPTSLLAYFALARAASPPPFLCCLFVSCRSFSPHAQLRAAPRFCTTQRFVSILIFSTTVHFIRGSRQPAYFLCLRLHFCPSDLADVVALPTWRFRAR